MDYGGEKNINISSVANPDPGSSAFFTPESGIRAVLRIRDVYPESRN
jgi:hypothetical protein